MPTAAQSPPWPRCGDGRVYRSSLSQDVGGFKADAVRRLDLMGMEMEDLRQQHRQQAEQHERVRGWRGVAST